MKRLTTNKDVQEMGMVELARNSCYVKDGAAWYRDFSSDMDARRLARKLLKDFAEGDDSFTCDEDFDEYIAACLEDGMDSVEGLIALFYRNLWAMADLHAYLKYYEDLEEQGKLLKLPCKLGDATFWISDEDEDGNKTLTVREGNSIIGIAVQQDGLYVLADGDNEYQKVGGRWAFLTKESAEAALKEMSEWRV